MLENNNLNDFSDQLKSDWDINIEIKNDKFHINDVDFLLKLAQFNVPDKEAEILINYNDIDEKTKEKILNHKSFLSINANSKNTSFKDMAIIFNKVCYSIIKKNNVCAILVGEINLLISSETYLFEMDKYIEDNKYFPTNLWIRVDLFSDDNGNHAYTEGLKNFGKYEIMAYKTLRDAKSITTLLTILSKNIIENILVLDDYNTMQTDDDYIGMFKFFDNKFIMIEKNLKDINQQNQQ